MAGPRYPAIAPRMKLSVAQISRLKYSCNKHKTCRFETTQWSPRNSTANENRLKHAWHVAFRFSCPACTVGWCRPWFHAGHDNSWILHAGPGRDPENGAQALLGRLLHCPASLPTTKAWELPQHAEWHFFPSDPSKKSLSAILLTINMILHRQCPRSGISR